MLTVSFLVITGDNQSESVNVLPWRIMEKRKKSSSKQKPTKGRKIIAKGMPFYHASTGVKERVSQKLIWTVGSNFLLLKICPFFNRKTKFLLTQTPLPIILVAFFSNWCSVVWNVFLGWGWNLFCTRNDCATELQWWKLSQVSCGEVQSRQLDCTVIQGTKWTIITRRLDFSAQLWHMQWCSQ